MSQSGGVSNDDRRRLIELLFTAGAVLGIITAFLNPTPVTKTLFAVAIGIFVVASLRSYTSLIVGRTNTRSYDVSVGIMLGSFFGLLVAVVEVAGITSLSDPTGLIILFVIILIIALFAFHSVLGMQRSLRTQPLSGKLSLSGVNWRKVERILGRVATVLTVFFAAVSAYYAYQAVQVALNPVTTVELGHGNFTMTNAYGGVYSTEYTTSEFRISAYRYAILYPYLLVDLRLGYRSSIFGPVYTEVVVDGVTKATILYPPVYFNPSNGYVLTVIPRNVSTVMGLGLVTRTYCVGNCTIPNAEVVVRADLVR